MFKFIGSLFSDLFDEEAKYTNKLKTREITRFGVVAVYEEAITYGLNFKDDGIDYEFSLRGGQCRSRRVGLTKVGDMIEFAVASDNVQEIKFFRNLTQLKEKDLIHDQEKVEKSKNL